MSVQPASVSPAVALVFTRTLLTVTLTASKPQAGASVRATLRVPLVAAGVGAAALSPPPPPPPQAAREMAAMTLPASRPAWVNVVFIIVIPFEMVRQHGAADAIYILKGNFYVTQRT